jgi:hypothetical protein
VRVAAAIRAADGFVFLIGRREAPGGNGQHDGFE